MKIRFEPSALHAMHDWLLAHYPEEACGFLVGHEHSGVRTVVASWPAGNVSTENRKRRFIVDPIDYLHAEKRAVSEDVSLLGIYHSHPEHPAIPSAHDLAAAHPYFSYTIVSIMSGQVADTRSYQLIHREFQEEEVLTAHVESEQDKIESNA